ncbi:MAG: hypothetical protein PQJ49_01715 [Sphaerochaetaceae bacterium]|nr:hypothetical protein [Sphaerochaetaceae bacterium]
MYNPDKFIVLKIGGDRNPIYKVFATWVGGYLNGDRWRLNSGIVKVTQEGDLINFYGDSGSCYTCHVKTYGTNGYSQGVLDNIFAQANKQKISIEVLPHDTDWVTFFEKIFGGEK